MSLQNVVCMLSTRYFDHFLGPKHIQITIFTSKNQYFNYNLSLFLTEVSFDSSEGNQLSLFLNSRFRPVKHLKRTVWTSVLWKMNINMSKKWTEMVVEPDMCSQFYIETVFGGVFYDSKYIACVHFFCTSRQARH